MSISCFLYGLVAFAMAVVVLLRGRRNSRIALGQQFTWLSAFGFFSSVYAWGRMFQDASEAPSPIHDTATLLIPFALAAAGLMLVRFGIGLIADAGPLPDWMHLLPVVLLVPAMLLVAYAIIVVLSADQLEVVAEQWSRHLLLFPGSIFAAIGFLRQWRRLRQGETVAASGVLLAAAVAFVVNALFIGAIAEIVGLTNATIMASTGQSAEFWRLIVMTVVAALVMRSMRVFEIEREEEMNRLNAARREAQKMALTVHTRSRQESETWLDAVVKISRRVANLDDADDVLADVVLLARALVNADAAGIALYESDSRLKLRVEATASGLQTVHSDEVANPLIERSAQRVAPLRFPEDAPGSTFTWGANGSTAQATAAAIVPLQLNQSPIGALWVARKSGDSFTCANLIGLGYLANQAVIALEHASMAGRLQSLAVIEERSRIAREMHDGLAQLLGYLGLETQTLEALVRQEDTEAVLEELASARAAIKSAQADVRENILSLRTTLAGDIRLTDALKAYVDEFGIQTNIRSQLVNNAAENLTLSPLAETQCVRIVQEALTNVRKHARACEVQVELSSNAHWFEVKVVDNGVGLPAQPASNRHFGLQTMRERAEGVGGTLTIASPHGQGTTVRLRLPLL